MGYQESWVYIKPQRYFDKMIRAYEMAKQSGYYHIAGAEPRSVIILKEPFGEIPAGARILWVCGDRGFHNTRGIFGGNLRCGGRVQVIPVEALLTDTSDYRLDGIKLSSPYPSENAYMKRYSAANYAHRLRMEQLR